MKKININPKEKNSSIDLIKIVACFLVVLSHVIQSLWDTSVFVKFNDYILPIGVASNDASIITMTLLQ